MERFIAKLLLIIDNYSFQFDNENGILNDGKDDIIEDNKEEKLSRVKKLAKEYLIANDFDFEKYELELSTEKDINSDTLSNKPIDEDIENDDDWLNF